MSPDCCMLQKKITTHWYYVISSRHPTGWATLKQENKREYHAKFLLAGYVYRYIIDIDIYIERQKRIPKTAVPFSSVAIGFVGP